MSQVTRHHGPIGVRVPVGVLNAIDSLFGVKGANCEEFALYPSEALDLERLVIAPQFGDTIITTAEVVANARNVLDGWTLSDECTSDHLPEVGQQTPIGTTCDFCHWCQALILRDWLDMVLDRAGHVSRNAWIGVTPADYHPDAEYDRIWAVCNERYREDERANA